MMTMNWQDTLQEAIHESDPQIMDEKIRSAEKAIFARIRDFSSRRNSLEEQAQFDALGPSGYCEALDGFRNSVAGR